MSWAERISLFAVGTFLGFTIMFLLSKEYWYSIPYEQGDWSSPVIVIALVMSIGAILSVIWVIIDLVREK